VSNGGKNGIFSLSVKLRVTGLKPLLKNEKFTWPTPFKFFFKNALTGSGAFSWRVVNFFSSLRGFFGGI